MVSGYNCNLCGAREVTDLINFSSHPVSKHYLTQPSEQGIGVCLPALNTENEEKFLKRRARWIEEGGQLWSVLPPSDRLLQIWTSNDA